MPGSEPTTETRADPSKLTEENLRLREEMLVLRDQLVGVEAQLSEAVGRLRMLENELLRHQVFEQYMSSRTGRLLQAYHRIRSRIRERG